MPDNKEQQQQPHPLLRNVAAGMNPTNLLTGYYGARGERIRHVVHEGALRLPAEALQLIVSDNNNNETPTTTISLPGLDSVPRPSLDPQRSSIIVTDVWLPQVGDGVATKTLARNRRQEIVVHSSSSSAAERIRGGGEEPAEGAAAASLVSLANAAAASANQASARDSQATAAAPSGSIPATTTTATPQATEHPAAATGFVPPPSSLQAASAAPAVDSTAATHTPATKTTSMYPSAVPPPATTTTTVAPPAAAAVQAPVGVVATPTVGPATAMVPQNVAMAQQTGHQAVAPPPAVARVVQPVQPAAVSAGAASAAAVQVVAPPPAVPGVAQPVVAQSAAASAVAAVFQPPTNTTTAPTPATAAAPAPEAATAPRTAEAPAPPIRVEGLQKRPAAQWEQHMPGPHDEMQVDAPSDEQHPDWFHPDQIAPLEKALLPEWFNGSAPHRTPTTYKQVRNQLLQISNQLGTRYLTATMVRRSITPGDAGSLWRLHHFMTAHGLINADAINDSAPLPMSSSHARPAAVWDDAANAALLEAVVDESSRRKRRKVDDSDGDDSGVVMDWEAVGKIVGRSSEECERQFLSMPIITEQPVAERPITPDATSSSGEGAVTDNENLTRTHVLRQLVHNAHPKVVHAATQSALQAAAALQNDDESPNQKAKTTREQLVQAQQAAVAGIVASQAAEAVASQEEAVSEILNQVVELRMKRLENRMALLDDVEGMLEAERVALELERRDLYTSRCRHWFQGA